MCKNNYYIKDVATYFTQMLGEKVEFCPASKYLVDKIPIGISSNFSLYKSSILGNDVLLAWREDGDTLSPSVMQKQLSVISKQTGLNVILCTQRVASYNLSRWTAHKINFVIPQKQMFIPSLLLELKKEPMVGSDLKETMVPFTQLLLLYHLQVESIVGTSCSILKDKFSVSYATVNQSLRWLVKNGFIKMEGIKTKNIQMEYDNQELWNKALPFFVSPIDKIVFTDADLGGEIESGINALSTYTMLNPEPKSCIAISKKRFKEKKMDYNNQFGDTEVQVWKYDPHLLSSSGAVDRLSLFLTLKDNQDERVQIELEHLINEMQSLLGFKQQKGNG